MKIFSFFSLFLTVVISVLFSGQIIANATQPTAKVDFYYSKTYPHCAEEKPLLSYIDQQLVSVFFTPSLSDELLFLER